MTTTAAVLARVRHRFQTGMRDTLNQLQTGVDSDDNALTLKHANVNASANTRLSVDLEDMHVLTVSGPSAGATVEVIRAQNGSAAANHSADALIYVNPQVSSFEILTAVNDELGALSSQGLYRIKTVELTYSATRMGYDLTSVGADLLDVWRVRMDDVGPERSWAALRREEWRLDQDANTTDFVSGRQLVLFKSTTPGRKVRVSYKATYGTLAAVADNVETVTGLHTEAIDLLALGAAIRLGAGRDIKRSFMEAQHEPRRGDEVPPGSATNALRPLLALREMRLNEERARLAQRYPG